MIFTKSEMAANRVMKSITDWIERKLFLKVNATKTKVVRPTRSKYLGFTFLKNGSEWKVRPTTEKKKKLRQKVSEYLKRNKAIARPLAETIKRVNEIVRVLSGKLNDAPSGRLFRVDLEFLQICPSL